MITYRITKYNPAKRNEHGHYLDKTEWTAISDIGKTEYNDVTYEAYEQIESAYIDAIKLMMQDNNLDCLIIDSFEFHGSKEGFKNYEKTGRLRNILVDFDKEIGNLKNGLKLNFSEIEKIIRLTLRETMWMLLLNENFEVKFGFDYYMYVKAFNIKPTTIQLIEKAGLFVEAEIEPINYTFTEKEGNEI